MKTDISSIQDIQLIITKFYEKLLIDKKMAPFFDDIVQQNHLKNHIQVIANFWNDILFDTLLYRENVMQKHLQKNAMMMFQKVHFELWTSYFLETIDNNFLGLTADKMKSKALSISVVMQIKMKIYEPKSN